MEDKGWHPHQGQYEANICFGLRYELCRREPGGCGCPHVLRQPRKFGRIICCTWKDDCCMFLGAPHLLEERTDEVNCVLMKAVGIVVSHPASSRGIEQHERLGAFWIGSGEGDRHWPTVDN